jgi:LmbE family N-acetylglucosaminyl deacetylase
VGGMEADQASGAKAKMLGLELALPRASALRLLCLGAHCDDIEIGCGGTVLKLLDAYKEVTVQWVVFSSDERRAEEARRSAEAFLRGVKSTRIIIRDFKNSFFPFIGSSIKEEFEQLKRQFVPDLNFTHYRNDLHQDHRVISELTWNTFRDHLILEYEIPKYDGDLGSPNTFVHLDGRLCEKKIMHILENFKSQSEKHWFEREVFLSLMRLRGVESASPGRYAEAFYSRKSVLGGVAD